MEEKAGIIEFIEAVAKRLEKARALASNVRAIEGAEAFIVENEEGRKLYLVQNSTCTCPDFRQRKELHRGWCKHRLAVALANRKQNNKESR